MWVTSKTGKCLAFVSLCVAISISDVTSSPQRRRIRQGYINNNHVGESRYQPGHAVSPPALGLSPGRSKVNPVYGDQLQSLDQPSEYEAANYDFKYQIHGGGNYFGHEESRRDSKAQGQYHVLMPDGRRQVVTYYADETGYHPTITYEQVGPPPSNNNLSKQYGSSPPGNDGYRSKRSRYYKHSKRVHLKHPFTFKSSV